MHKGKYHFILSCGSLSHFAFQGQMWTERFWYPGTRLLYDPGDYCLAELLRPQSPSLDEVTQHLILPLAMLLDQISPLSSSPTHTHTHTQTHTHPIWALPFLPESPGPDLIMHIFFTLSQNLPTRGKQDRFIFIKSQKSLLKISFRTVGTSWSCICTRV